MVWLLLNLLWSLKPGDIVTYANSTVFLRKLFFRSRRLKLMKRLKKFRRSFKNKKIKIKRKALFVAAFYYE